MRIPFERLMEMVEELGREHPDITLGEMARNTNVSVDRVMDAIDANRVCRGERTYIGVDDE